MKTVSNRYNHTLSLDRSRRGHSQRPARAHSAARFEENHYASKVELNPRDYTMTLPASRGRHRSRINGKLYTHFEIYLFYKIYHNSKNNQINL